jgi:hypothetical protein
MEVFQLLNPQDVDVGTLSIQYPWDAIDSDPSTEEESEEERIEVEKTNNRRHGFLPDVARRVLVKWLQSHRSDPFPNELEKAELACASHLTLTQVPFVPKGVAVVAAVSL